MLIHRSLGALKSLGEGSKVIQVVAEAVPARAEKEFSRHRAFQKGVRLLTAKSSDNQGTVNAVGRPFDRPEKGVIFPGLIVNFYSLKTKFLVIG